MTQGESEPPDHWASVQAKGQGSKWEGPNVSRGAREPP